MDLVYKVARIYGKTKPAFLKDGNGLDQHTNVVQTARAIAILRAITGNLDIVGGDIFPSALNINSLALPEKIPDDAYEKSVCKKPLYFRDWHAIPGSELIDAIVTGKPYPIKVLIVQGGSPGVVLSNTNRVIEGLRKLDFIVVQDIFMNDTAELADIVLPAATFLEQSLLTAPYPLDALPVNKRIILLMNKVVEPLGECWSDFKFISELSKHMGYEKYFPWRTVEEAFEDELRPSGLTIEKLKEHPEGITMECASRKLYKKYELKGFDTYTGKVELYSRVLEQEGYDPSPTYKEPAESPISRPDIAAEYPLICGGCLKLGIFTHTQFRTLAWLNEIVPEPFVEIHPQKARELGIGEGETVFVESLRGRIAVVAKVTETVDPRVVMIAHGWGQPYAHGAKTNTLTEDAARCPISGATGNRSFLCRVRKA